MSVISGSRIFFSFVSSHNENQNQEYSKSPETTVLSVAATENFLFSGRLVDSEILRTCSGLHLLQNKKIKKVLFLV